MKIRLKNTRFSWIVLYIMVALMVTGIGWRIIPVTCFHWDCDDYALFYYDVANTLHLNPVIKAVSGKHVWISIYHIDINSGGYEKQDYRIISLDALKESVQADKDK